MNTSVQIVVVVSVVVLDLLAQLLSFRNFLNSQI
jgi:hypothetical protein